MAPKSSVVRRRSGEVASRRPTRAEPQAERAVVSTPAEFRAREAQGKARQRIAGERAGEAKARRRLAEARASAAEAKRDAPPPSEGPRGRVAPPGRSQAAKVSKGLDRATRSFLRLGTANPRRVLLIELLGVLVVVTVDQLAHGQMPEPRVYAGGFVVFLVLAFAAELGGTGGARVATGFGALVLLSVVLANAPGIVKALQVASGQRATAQEGVA
jgi:hypothetical protein